MMANEQERDPRLDRLYGEAGRDAPPARLDAAILAAAHREVGSRPRPLSAALHRWRVPVSIAALVVLSVSLVTLVHEKGVDDPARVAPGEPVIPAPAPEEAAPAAPPDSSKPSAAAPAARSGVARPAPRGDGHTGAQRELGAMADRARRDAEAGPSGMGTSAEPKPAAKPLPQPFRAPPWLGFENEPPQKWLDRIVELRKQGQTEAADQMLAEFRRRFPGHPVQ